MGDKSLHTRPLFQAVRLWVKKLAILEVHYLDYLATAPLLICLPENLTPSLDRARKQPIATGSSVHSLADYTLQNSQAPSTTHLELDTHFYSPQADSSQSMPCFSHTKEKERETSAVSYCTLRYNTKPFPLSPASCTPWG